MLYWHHTVLIIIPADKICFNLDLDETYTNLLQFIYKIAQNWLLMTGTYQRTKHTLLDLDGKFDI